VKTIGLREFRDNIDSIDEPVRVFKTRNGVVELGTWVPAKIEFDLEFETMPRKKGENKVEVRVRAKKASDRAVS